jgi:hypothetical protein
VYGCSPHRRLSCKIWHRALCQGRSGARRSSDDNLWSRQCRWPCLAPRIVLTSSSDRRAPLSRPQDSSVATCPLCPSFNSRGGHRDSGLGLRRRAENPGRSARTALPLNRLSLRIGIICVEARIVIGRKRRRCQNGRHQGSNKPRHCFPRHRGSFCKRSANNYSIAAHPLRRIVVKAKPCTQRKGTRQLQRTCCDRGFGP